MKYISGFIRIFSGAAIILLAYVVYLDVAAEVDLNPSATAVVFGHQLGIANDILLKIVIGAGIFGGLLCVLGVATLVSKGKTVEPPETKA